MAQKMREKPLARLSDRSDDLLFSRMLGAPATVACRERASPEGSLNRLSQLHCCGGSWLAPSVDTSREYVPEARVTVRLAARGTGEVLEYPATAAATRSRAARTRRFQTHLGGCRNGSKIRLQIASFTAKSSCVCGDVNSIVAKFRSVSTSSPKETRNFVTAVNTSSEISLFRLVPVIEDLPRIALPFRQRSPVAGLFRLVGLRPAPMADGRA